METEATGSQSSSSSASFKRPRPLLLMLLALLVLAAVLMKLMGSAGPRGATFNPPRAAQERSGGETGRIDPAALDVKLEALAGERPAPPEAERNPFRFKPKPAPPPPPAPPQNTSKPPPESTAPIVPQPPAPPAITVKFIGTLELSSGLTVAIFTDCTIGRKTRPYREGETILGQYRLVKIGLQSVVVEHLDGRGRTTLPKTGQECVK